MWIPLKKVALIQTNQRSNALSAVIVFPEVAVWSNRDRFVNVGFQMSSDISLIADNKWHYCCMPWYSYSHACGVTAGRAHVRNCYDNAFWNGEAIHIGDGCSTFHPLSSIDVVAHEVAHGFTTYTSGLVYSSQSGGMNEAFSDMAGVL